ncbi:MAG TPA: tRNA pseudouridine(55) synthase TruB [Candidatus Anaerobiospirillum stercoravium]|nr:tRNA pseudouridine(55) synthase TruB [Candidatus Anaerobiospirillum stercoravium]
MAKRKINGIFLLDKPEGITSSTALVKTRAIFKAQKGGHTGALDPQASGLLPICLGEAAKFSSFFLEGKKRYLAEGTLGKTTTTCDREGEVVIEREIGDAMERLEATLGQFVGTIVQVPPIYSAVKVNGKPLYKYARQGREDEVEIPQRTVEIYELKLLERTATTFKVEVFCSKGTYIRTLISDIGEALDCGAYVSHLRRVYVEGLPQGQMTTLEQLQHLADSRENRMDFTALDSLLIPIESALGNLPVVELPRELAEPLSHGMKVRLSNAENKAELKLPEPFPELNSLVQVQYHGLFLGVCYFSDPNLLVPKRMMDPDVMAQRLVQEQAAG